MDPEMLIRDLMPQENGVVQGAHINEELVNETEGLEWWVPAMQVLSDHNTLGY